MKTTDRSLQIVAVGLGQAGGNLAAEFSRRGYPGLAFNTARTDLQSLGAAQHALTDSQRVYIGLEGHDGAGSDIEYGRECILQHADRIREAVREHAAGADVVLVAAGLGGGTGSNVAELVNQLDELELPVVVLTTLPHSHESGIAKVNALTGVRNLAETPTYGWALVDNSRLARLHHDAPMASYFETINAAIAEPLDVFNRLNDRDSTRAIRTLDGEDFRTLLLTGGVLNYHSQPLPLLSSEGVLEAVRGALVEGPMMPAGFELSDVAYLGLAIEASERALAESPFSIWEEIAGQLKHETGGAAIYLGLYRGEEHDGAAATLRLISSSNALPASIGTLLTEAEREANTIQQKVQKSVRGLDLGGIDELHLTRRPVRSGARADRLARPVKRARHSLPEPVDSPPAKPAAEGGPEAAPAAEAPVRDESPPRPSGPVAQAVESVARRMSRRESGPRAQTAGQMARKIEPGPRAGERSQVAELRRLVAVGGAEEPAAAEPAAEPAGESPSADTYRTRFERLAESYRAASAGDSKRMHIGRELVASLRSEVSLERLHAAATMGRLDARFFRDALRSAAEDPDPHVAEVAKRALKGAS